MLEAVFYKVGNDSVTPQLEGMDAAEAFGAEDWPDGIEIACPHPSKAKNPGWGRG